MEKQNQKSFEDLSLRHKAEEKIEFEHAANINHSDTFPEQKRSEAELQKLIHELQVYQIEPEMQNDELKRAVEKAETATELYDFAPTGYFTLQPDSSITQLNFSGAKMLGKQRANLLNSRLIQFLSMNTLPAFKEFLANIFSTSTKQSCEVRLSIQDKPAGFLFLEGIISQDKQKCLLTAVDITERKRMEEALSESEARFRSTFDQSPVGSVLTGIDLRLIRCNAAFCKFLGYAENELIGRSISEITHPEDQELAKMETKELLERKLETVILQKRYIRKDGQVVWGEISICVVRDTENNPLYFLPIIQDITERRKAEQALKENEVRLRELNATKDKFFSIIAHDLRSPFNGIQGFSNILVGQIEEKNYEGIENYARIIQNSSQRAMSLLMNLLEWSRLQTGRMKFSPEYVEMVALLNEITELFSDSATQKSITIFREFPRNIHAFVDKAMISTVLRNLISNAIKFTNPGGEIYISAEQKPDEILFSVSDSGVGMKNEAIEKLFRIETSSSTKGTKNESGTGLGLVLCKEFVENHGGKIWVESEVGIGSTFRFTIPVKMVI